MTDFAFTQYEKLRGIQQLRQSLLTTAAKQASIEYVLQHAQGTQEDIQAFRDAEADYQTTDPLSGNTVNHRRHRTSEGQDLPEGMEYVEGPGPTHADAHLSILDACMRGAVARWNGFEWLISANAGNNNLPTDLSAESPFVLRTKFEQGNYTEAYRECMFRAVRHYVDTRGLPFGVAIPWETIERECELKVEAPSPQVRNKLEESQRAQAEIPLGVESRQRYMQEQGRDPDEIEADNEAWAAAHPEPAPAATPPGPGAKPPGGDRDSDGLPATFESIEPTATHGRELLESESQLVPKEITDRLGRHRTVMVIPDRFAKHHDQASGKQTSGLTNLDHAAVTKGSSNLHGHEADSPIGKLSAVLESAKSPKEVAEAAKSAQKAIVHQARSVKEAVPDIVASIEKEHGAKVAAFVGKELKGLATNYADEVAGRVKEADLAGTVTDVLKHANMRQGVRDVISLLSYDDLHPARNLHDFDFHAKYDRAILDDKVGKNITDKAIGALRAVVAQGHKTTPVD
jgi:hypothetical protein